MVSKSGWDSICFKWVQIGSRNLDPGAQSKIGLAWHEKLGLKVVSLLVIAYMTKKSLGSQFPLPAVLVLWVGLKKENH
jgi:hypothetical protein